MSKNKRPLSPFMLGSEGYKLQSTSVLSFLHRATGVALVVVLLVVGCWIGAVATGIHAFNRINGLLTHWAFFPILVLGVIAGTYHFCNGIRHLFWDLGKGLELECAEKSARIVQIATIVISLALITVGIVA